MVNKNNTKHFKYRFVSLGVLVAVLVTAQSVFAYNTLKYTDSTHIKKAAKTERPIGKIRPITAQELVADMKPGWNFGNSFDARAKDKTEWGNPLPTTAVVDAVYNKGFRTLRLPVTWGYNMGEAPDFIIENTYFARVEKILSHALEKGMYVILNVHHDDKWIKPLPQNATDTRDQLDKVWTQIANRFKDYSDYLIFEVLNEPRHIDTPQEWNGGTSIERSVLNTYNKTALDAIRRTGGNNAKRKIMVAPYAASVKEAAWQGFVIPNNDKDVIVSLHAYYPFRFALDGSDPNWGTKEDKKDIKALFKRIESRFLKKGLPIIMGEWGSIKTIAPASERVKHAHYFVSMCLEKGIVPVVWDDGGDFGLLNRKTLEWDFSNIANGAANNGTAATD